MSMSSKAKQLVNHKNPATEAVGYVTNLKLGGGLLANNIQKYKILK